MFLSHEELKKKSSDWADTLGVSPSKKVPLKNPALLVLDMQNEFLTKQGQLPVWGGPAIIPNILLLITFFRKQGWPVFFTKHYCLEPLRHKGTLKSMDAVSAHRSFLSKDSVTSELHKSFEVAEQDILIKKYKYSAFYETPLQSYLQINKRIQVVITGVATNICCDSTARDAFYRGYDVYFPFDATGGVSEESHLETLKTMALSFGTICMSEQLIDNIEE